MRKIFVLLGIFLLNTILFACTPKSVPVENPSSGASSPETPTITKSSSEAWEMEWDKTKQEAKKEGKALIYTSAGFSTRQALTRAMKDKFGLIADWVSGRGSEIGQKIIMERRAGLYLADLYISGPGTPMTFMKPIGALEPLMSHLILPEVKDPGMWWQNRLPFVDKEQMLFAFTATHSNPITYNTNLVKKEEMNSYWDILNPKWEGKIIWNDPTTSGSGNSFFTVAAMRLIGLDYFKEMVKLKPAFTRDERLQVESIARGKYAIGFCASADNVTEFIEAGAPITEHTPKEGSYLTSSGGVIMLFNKAPHTYSARLFLNFLLSKEGQDLWDKLEGVQSGRIDASTEGLSPINLRRPGFPYVSGDEEEILLSKPRYREIANEIFGPLLR